MGKRLQKTGPWTIYVDPDSPSFRQLVLEATGGRGLSKCVSHKRFTGGFTSVCSPSWPPSKDGRSPEDPDRKQG